jgi:hypothetical protein
MTRRADRVTYDQPTRIGLLESDADAFADSMVRLETMLDAKVEELRKTVAGVQKVLIGILISLATASILLAINIGVVGK